ncbi:MAG: RDD family protein [Phycisphaerales bacterium]
MTHAAHLAVRPIAAWRAVILRVLLALCVMLSITPCARAQSPATGDGESAWIVHEDAFGQWVLFRLTGAAPALRVRAAATLPRPAVALGVDPDAAAGGRCVVVLRPEGGVHPLREVSFTTSPNPRIGEVFDAPRVLTPLGDGATEGGRVVGVRIEGGVVFVVREQPTVAGAPPGTDEPAPSTIGPFNVFALDNNRWTPAAIGCVWNHSEASLECVPTLAWPRRQGSTPMGRSLVIDGDVFGVRREGGDLVVTLGAAPDSPETARLKDVPQQSAVVMLGGQVVALWRHTETGGVSGELWCAAVTPLGVEVYRGPVSREGVLPRREIVTLAWVFLMLAASVLAWVLVPVRWRRPVTPPSGFVYAEVSRRGAACLIDLLPGFLLMEVTLRALSWVPEDALGVWPALGALVFSALLSGLGEGVFGRSLGKWLLRCEVRTAEGTRPGRWRGAARGMLKFLCPPLALLHLAVPAWKWTNPVSLGTAVVREEPGPGSQ